MADNLRIWSQVEKTDPDHTKKVNQRGGFTAISAAYQIMRATEVFGPIGEGWGYDAGAPIFQDSVVFVPVTMWHGTRANVFGPMFGGAEWKASGGRTDSDAAKKATTDALTKLLSQLGFNADVFMGKFDDNKYLAEITAEFAEAKVSAAVKAATVAINQCRTREELEGWAASNKEGMASMSETDRNTTRGIYSDRLRAVTKEAA